MSCLETSKQFKICSVKACWSWPFRSHPKDLPIFKKDEATTVSASQSEYCSLRGSIAIKIQKRARLVSRRPVMYGRGIPIAQNFRMDDGVHF